MYESYIPSYRCPRKLSRTSLEKDEYQSEITERIQSATDIDSKCILVGSQMGAKDGAARALTFFRRVSTYYEMIYGNITIELIKSPESDLITIPRRNRDRKCKDKRSPK